MAAANPARVAWVALSLTAAFAVALLLAPAVGDAVPGPAAVLAAGLIAGLSVAYGLPLTALIAPPARVPRHLVTVIVGFCAVSLVHLGATALLDLPARQALGVDLVGAVTLALVTRRQATGAIVVASSRDLAMQVAVLLACAGVAALWTRETATALPHAVATGTFPAWQDYFLHAAEVGYLRDYPAYEQHSQYLSAVPQPLYHRGSYAMPALLSDLGSVTTLAAATTFWMPAGLLLCVVATYVWGAALGAPITGLVAVAAAFLVPDASTYGLENRFLSFHWLLQMAGGSGYALALTLTALALLATADPARPLRAFGVALALALAGAGFRVHVSLLSMAMIAVLALLSVRLRPTARVLMGLAVGGVCVIAVLAWMESVALAPHILSGGTNVRNFFVSVMTQASGLASPYVEWTLGRGQLAAFALGYPMMLAAGCGLWLVALVLAWASGGLARLGWRVGAVPVALVVAHMAVIRFVPTPAHGDPTDFGHRPFVLVYLVVATLGAVGLVTVARACAVGRRVATTAFDGAIVTAALVGLVVPWREGATIQQRWTPAYAQIPMSLATFEAGAYVRQHSAPGEQMLAASEDPLAVFVALGERQAWLSRTALYRSLGPAFAVPADARAAAHASLAGVTTFDALKAFGATTGVAWYIADTPASRDWPAAITSHCVYCGDDVRVYDLR